MYKVVLIDDEMWSMVDIKKTIPFAEFDMELTAFFTDSITALIDILNQKPDIIITDIRMPNLNGLELIKRIRENSVNSEIIIISAYSDFDVARQAISYGVCGYCIKPIDTDELTSLLLSAKERLDKKSLGQSSLINHIKEDSMDPFDKMVQYIEQNYCKNLKLNDLAEQFFINPNYCASLFAKRKKTTFTKFLTKIRLNASKFYIENSKYTLCEIAQKVGFQDYSYFSKVFKNKIGVSPRDYQNKHRGNSDT